MDDLVDRIKLMYDPKDYRVVENKGVLLVAQYTAPYVRGGYFG